MKVRTARIVDRLVGTPLCWILNVLTRGLGTILRRDHVPPYNPRRILLIKLMGMGSIVEALPLLRGLSKQFPNAEVQMLCFPETAILTRRIREVSSVVVINNSSFFRLAITTLSALTAILRQRPDLVLDLEYHSKFSPLLTTLTAAQNRAGFFDVTTAFREYLHTHLIYANPRQHISDLYCHMGRAFGVNSFDALEQCVDSIDISPSEESEAAAFLKRTADSRPLILINVNAGELCLERRWPGYCFAELAAELTEAGKVILVGSLAEKPYVASVRSMIGDDSTREQVENAAGALSFGAYMALLKRAALVITNDSGPMHLAAVLGVPVVSLWGPGEPETYEPRTPHHIAVSEYVFCSPCLYITHEPPCAGNNICMKILPVSRVLEAIAKVAPSLLSEPGIRSRRPGEAHPDSLPGIYFRS